MERVGGTSWRLAPTGVIKWIKWIKLQMIPTRILSIISQRGQSEAVAISGSISRHFGSHSGEDRAPTEAQEKVIRSICRLGFLLTSSQHGVFFDRSFGRRIRSELIIMRLFQSSCQRASGASCGIPRERGKWLFVSDYGICGSECVQCACSCSCVVPIRYYDFLSAYSAVNQGHCHPKVSHYLEMD